ncbi:MAG TPA: hypothetical protein VIF63_07775 [Candidatus Limnocylindrales bacterium]|jgi:hypothetical protein
MYRQSKSVWLLATLVAWAMVMLSVPAALALPLAIGHAQYHAVLALVVLLPALVIALRKGERPTIASTAPIAGLAIFAVTQLVESIGGLGYGPDNDGRVNGLVAFHDLGVAITPIGLLAVLVGLTAGVGALIGRRFRRPALAAAVSAFVLVVGGIGVAKLIGF